MKRKRLVTVEEAILLHLMNYRRYGDEPEVPISVTQAGISRALGVRRSHISTSLDTAKKKELVAEKIAHVKDEKRRRKSYFLTAQGLESAKSLESKLLGEKIIGLLKDGSKFEGTLEDYVAKLGMERELSRVAIHTHDGKVELADLVAEDAKPASSAPIPQVKSFVGRHKELREIREFLSNRKKILMVQGMPGIGKTTLIAHSLGEIRTEPVFWFNVNQWSSPRNTSTHLAEFLDARSQPRLKRYLAAHETLDMADLQDIMAETTTTSTLIFDDCQESSQNLKILLKMLISMSIESPNLKLILIGRDLEDIFDFRTSLKTDITLEIKLTGLDEEASKSILKMQGVGSDEISEIVKNSSGHPLYLTLVKKVGEDKPADIENLIATETLAGLSETELELLSRLSVFRKPVHRDAIVETNDDFQILDALISKSLILQNEGLHTHAILQNYIYNRQAPDNRRSHHENAAEFYNSQSSHPENRIEETYHLIKAEDLESALMLMQTDGRSWLKQGYQEELLATLDMLAIDKLEPEDRYQATFLKAFALDQIGEWEQAAILFSRSREIAEALDSEVMEAAALQKLGTIHYRKGEMEKASQLFQDAERKAADAPLLKAEIENGLGVVNWRLGNSELALKSYESDYAISKEAKNQEGMARALNNMGILNWEAGKFDKALEMYASAMKLAENLNDHKLTTILYSNIADAYKSKEEPAEALRYYERCLSLSKELEFKWQVAETYRGMAELVDTKRDEYLRLALETFEKLGAKEDVKVVKAML